MVDVESIKTPQSRVLNMPPGCKYNTKLNYVHDEAKHSNLSKPLINLLKFIARINLLKCIAQLALKLF